VSGVTFNISYLQSSQTFPTLATGLAFTITNTLCRITTLFAPLLAEIMPNPSISVVVGALIAGILQTCYSSSKN